MLLLTAVSGHILTSKNDSAEIHESDRSKYAFTFLGGKVLRRTHIYHLNDPRDRRPKEKSRITFSQLDINNTI